MQDSGESRDNLLTCPLTILCFICFFLSNKNSDCRSKLDVGRLCIIMMVTFIKCIMYNSLLTTCVFALRCIICLNYVVNLLFTPYLAMAIDQQLHGYVSQVKVNFPSTGEPMLAGILRSQGIYIQRDRLRDSIHRTDPINTALRWHQLVRRRPYSVRCGTLMVTTNLCAGDYLSKEALMDSAAL